MISSVTVAINGTEHWVNRDGHRLHVWEKTGDKPASVGKVTLLVHGGTYSGQTDFDIQVPGKDFSLMDHLVGQGHDVFTFAVWGYGKSDRPEDGFQVTTESAIQASFSMCFNADRLQNEGGRTLMRWGRSVPSLTR